MAQSYRQTLLILLMLSTWTSADEAPSDHRPVISPDGETVVFMSTREGGDWELFSISTEGKELKRLTEHEGWDGYAVWSPDSGSFLFQRDIDDSRGAYRYDVVTGRISPFVVMHDANVSASGWSDSAGEVVLFVERNEKRDLYLSDTVGANLRRLTDTPDANEHDAHFSPDGRKLAFAVVFDGGSALDVMDLTTGEVQRHVTSTEYLYGLDWSPDGTQIAYTDTPNDNPDGNAELYVLDVAEAKVRRLTDDENYDHMPVWLPGGQEIMFSSYASGREEIYILALEDGGVRKFPSGLGAQ